MFVCGFWRCLIEIVVILDLSSDLGLIHLGKLNADSEELGWDLGDVL